jgi:hypothetical protein
VTEAWAEITPQNARQHIRSWTDYCVAYLYRQVLDANEPDCLRALAHNHDKIWKEIYEQNERETLKAIAATADMVPHEEH